MTNQGMIARAVSVAAFVAAVSATGAAQQPEQSVASTDPEVSVNIRNENRPADRVINFTATPGSYVTVIRVSPLGRVEVLYPTNAVVDRAMVPTSKRVPVPRTPTPSNPLSEGSIFAFVSSTPFVFSKVADNSGWNSLHLANYSAATDAATAEAFGNEIAAPNSRVMMSKATTAPVAIISRDHSPRMASLAYFRNKPCPSLSLPVNYGAGTVGCIRTPDPVPNTVQTQSKPQPSTSSK